MLSYQYRKSHCGDKTVVRSSYLHNGIPYTGKMTSLYWIRALLSLAFVNKCNQNIQKVKYILSDKTPNGFPSQRASNAANNGAIMINLPWQNQL